MQEPNILDTIEPLHIENRRYLGAKSRMLDFISQTIQPYMSHVDSVADIFAGTGVVSEIGRASCRERV